MQFSVPSAPSLSIKIPLTKWLLATYLLCSSKKASAATSFTARSA